MYVKQLDEYFSFRGWFSPPKTRCEQIRKNTCRLVYGGLQHMWEWKKIGGRPKVPCQLATFFISKKSRVPKKNGMFSTYRVDRLIFKIFFITYHYTITHFSIHNLPWTKTLFHKKVKSVRRVLKGSQYSFFFNTQSKRINMWWTWCFKLFFIQDILYIFFHESHWKRSLSGDTYINFVVFCFFF